jgi:hypothetical protein
MLAVTTGNQRRGRVIFYRYNKVNNELTFSQGRDLEVGIGAYDIVADDATGRLYVSSPGSDHVAVLAGNPTQVIRRIPTEASPYGLAWGGGYLWVVEAGARSISAISPTTLKVVRTLSLPSAHSPQVIAWLGEEEGLNEGRLFVGDAGNGKLYVINPDQMISGLGQASIEATHTLGRSLTHITAHEGLLVVTDGKRRALYYAPLSRSPFSVTENSSDFASYTEVPFATQSLLSSSDGLWLATGGALWRVSFDGSVTHDMFDQPARHISLADPTAIGGPGYVLSDGSRLENSALVDDELTPIVGLYGANIHRATPFILHSDEP